MSWFYEALMRAEGKAGEPDKSAVSSVQEGDSFLQEIEAISSVAAGNIPCLTDRDYGAERLITEEVPGIVSKVTAERVFRHLKVSFREESRLIFHTDPLGMAAEQFRILRRSLAPAFPTGAALVITSPAPGDGKTLTAINLCACLADTGDETLLLEADLRRPSARNVLSCAVDAPGVEDALRGTATAEEATLFVENLGFHAMLVAKVPKNPSHLLTGAGIQKILAYARPRFRWVVLDTAPVMPNADVAELLTVVDAALLVIRAQNTPKELSRRALELLGKRLHGVVLNEATIHSTPYYRYLSNYYQPVAS